MTDPNLPALPPGYELKAVLSVGKDGGVVRARRNGTDWVLRVGRVGGEVRAELAVLAAVEHPGLGMPADFGEFAGGWFVAREWVAGSDLGEWSRGRTPEEIGAVLARLCAPIAHLHELNLAHGDLKPANVFVRPDGGVVLGDLGMAGSFGNATGGSLFALAPERLNGGPTSPAADLFALGASCVHLFAPTGRSSRDFFARFPERSYLNALGVAPEVLPEWSRDLIVELLGRDPERRPSAAEVGHALASRLDLKLPRVARWTPRLAAVAGREEIWRSLWDELSQSNAANLARVHWLQLECADDVGPWFERLHLELTLRGMPNDAVDSELLGRGAADPAALDQAIDTRLGSGSSEALSWLLVAAGTDDPWTARACEGLVRGARAARRPILVVSTYSAPSKLGAVRRSIPGLDASALLGELQRTGIKTSEAGWSELAAEVVDLAKGSVVGARELLRTAYRCGRLVGDAASLRCLAGPALTNGYGIASRIDSGPEPELVQALRVVDSELSPTELASIVERDVVGVAREVLQLASDGWVRILPSGGVRLAASAGGPLGRGAFVRGVHARWAAKLLSGNPSDPDGAVHLWASKASGAALDSVHAALRAARDGGTPERALIAVARLRQRALERGLRLEVREPRVVLEEGSAWCAMGDPDRALALAHQLASEESALSQACAAGLRGRANVLLHRTNAALESFELAQRLAPELEDELVADRLYVLHSAGRDAEVAEIAELFDARAREQGGRLLPRQRAYIEALLAMGAFRRGDTEKARSALIVLIEEARSVGDAGREASFLTDLATVERRTGHVDRSEMALDRALVLYESAGLVTGVAQTLTALGGLLRDRGELIEGESHLVRAVALRERLGDVDGARLARGVLGRLRADRGHVSSGLGDLIAAADGFEGAQRLQHLALVSAWIEVASARIGRAFVPPPELDPAWDADPRVRVVRARSAWLLGDLELARSRAETALRSAERLGAEPVVREARRLLAGLDDLFEESSEDEERVLALLGCGAELDVARAQSLAEDLAASGRDDRAARVWLAIAARASDGVVSGAAITNAAAAFEQCSAGLGEAEARSLRRMLLDRPDPWPTDLAARPRTESQGFNLDDDMNLLRLLEINRKLVQVEDRELLVGVIVDHAIEVTGAERGFLVLEENGELVFDTALDSSRGGIDRPELEVSRSVVVDALAQMRTLRTSNAADDPMLASAPSVVSLELRSVLCVPFRVSDELRGAIYLDHRLRTAAFSEQDERLCALLADQAALAIQQVDRLQTISRLNRRLEGRVSKQEGALETARRELAASGRSAPLEEMIGGSAAMRKVHADIERAAPTGLPVLIQGDSGTGKELAARALHRLSSRASGVFVAESCAVLPENLIESELFGYVRGAFTGAERDREGLFERSNGGTLFLDEIGEMPIELQPRLLRVLETGEVRRVGDDDGRKVDVRLLVATNRDLEEEIRAGRFREDLFYRLDGLRIQMPRLEERVEDIPLLVEHFLRTAPTGNGAAPRFSRSVLSALSRRAWPGNVRELRNEVARLCVISDGDVDDPNLIRQPRNINPSTQTPGGAGAPITLEEVERRAILDALEYTGGDKRKAAELLGISRAKIYQRLKDWRYGETDA